MTLARVRSRHLRTLSTLALSALVLFGCGGGGSGGGAVTPPAPAPAPTPAPSFPVLLTSAAFSLPSIVDPVERSAVPGHQLGRVLQANGTPAPAGLTVDWLDASTPASPRVLASATTGAGGTFDIAGTSAIAAADQWLRVTLPDGAVVRGFASGWTELSVGTEVAVAEIARLRSAGALATRPLPMAELAIGQQSLSLLGQAQYAAQGGAGAIKALTAYVAQFLPWNQYLDRLASATPDAGPGDVAAFLPFEPTQAALPGTFTDSGINSSMPVNLSCFRDATPKWRECAYSVPSRADLGEQLSVRPDAIYLHNLGGTDGLDKLIAQIGDLPLLEFAPAIGTRVLYNNAQLVQDGDPTIHAAIKVTRRTYPMAPVAAQNGNVMAIEVVLDYEVAILNTSTRQQGDILVRERRWFSPLGGRVKIASEGLARTGTTITPANIALSIGGNGFTIAPALPMTGAVDAVALPLAHRHAIYSAARNSVYISTDSGGGQIAELDAATLATVRSVATGSVPTRLAVSADGSRLYAGLAGGSVLELRGADLSEVRRFSLDVAPFGEQPYDIVREIAVDPFDAERVLTVASSSRNGALSPVRLFASGSLQSSVTGADYYPTAVAWSAVPNQFFVGSNTSPSNLYRFGVNGAGATELASLLRVNEIGVREVAGILLTPGGQRLDAQTFSSWGKVALPGYPLTACIRLDGRSDLCEVQGYSVTGVDATYVRFDQASGAFLGAYLPTSTATLKGCPLNPTTQLWTASGPARLVPMGDGRLLVSHGEVDQRCGLEVWSLRGTLAAP